MERRRADPHPQPRGRAVRQPGGGGGLRGRLRGRDRGFRHRRDVLVRGLPGRHLPLRWPRAVPHGRGANGGPHRAAADRQDAPRAAGLGLAWPARPVRALLPAGHGQDRLQDPADLPSANTAKDGGRCCQPFGRSTIVWGAGKEYPVRARTSRSCCSGRGTAVWATDGASPIGRALGAGVAVLLLAGSVLGAPATPPAVTEADIERARQQHRCRPMLSWRWPLHNSSSNKPAGASHHHRLYGSLNCWADP